MKSIYYCGSLWSVHYKSMEDDGECDFEKERIYINRDLTPYRKQLALVHELLHVWYDHAGVADDEALVSQSEHGVLELILLFGGNIEDSIDEDE